MLPQSEAIELIMIFRFLHTDTAQSRVYRMLFDKSSSKCTNLTSHETSLITLAPEVTGFDVNSSALGLGVIVYALPETRNRISQSGFIRVKG